MLAPVSLDGGAGGVAIIPPGPPGGTVAGVVLLPAISGVNDYVRRMALRLADHGFAVFALDYEGPPPDLRDPKAVGAAVGALSDRQVVADVDAAVQWLGEQPGVDGDRVGVLGVCVGGSLAILAGAQSAKLACAVAFYGVLRYAAVSDHKPVSPLDAAGELRVPLLGHWGEADHLVPRADVEELQSRLRGRAAEIYLYPGAGHAFHEDFRDVYRPVAAAEAWNRSLRYLDWYLRGIPA